MVQATALVVGVACQDGRCGPANGGREATRAVFAGGAGPPALRALALAVRSVRNPIARFALRMPASADDRCRSTPREPARDVPVGGAAGSSAAVQRPAVQRAVLQRAAADRRRGPVASCGRRFGGGGMGREGPDGLGAAVADKGGDGGGRAAEGRRPGRPPLDDVVAPDPAAAAAAAAVA